MVHAKGDDGIIILVIKMDAYFGHKMDARNHQFSLAFHLLVMKYNNRVPFNIEIIVYGKYWSNYWPNSY